MRPPEKTALLPLSVAVLEDMLLLEKVSRLSITPFTQAQ